MVKIQFKYYNLAFIYKLKFQNLLFFIQQKNLLEAALELDLLRAGLTQQNFDVVVARKEAPVHVEELLLVFGQRPIVECAQEVAEVEAAATTKNGIKIL
jgi:hypothetical protein